MDTFSLFKFWKTNKTKIAVNDDGDGETITDSTFSDPLTEFSDDDDDSFFELELTLPKFSSKESNLLSLTRPEPDLSVTNLKPQSPISILRSASPNLRVFMFGKLNKKSNTENDGNVTKSKISDPFTVKFKIEDGSIVPKLTRTNSSNSNRSKTDDSKRFSKDVVQKYLNFVKPLYTKKSNEVNEGVTVSCYSPKRKSSSSVSSVSFPSPMKEKEKSSRFKVKSTKHLGKSKSSSAMIVSSSQRTISRNDVPCDGIESAILHCKRSFESTTKGQSSLSRCSSDPSHEKSMTVSEQRL